jgi:NTP pyrophosphatase (non-canonical NTP hydrolase)
MSKANLTPEFLERCRAITTAFEQRNGTWNLSNQLLHIYSEVGEIQKALRDGNKTNLLEECCDTILTTITIFDLLGIDKERILQIMELTLQKVELRAGLIKL